jgi:hypothetical protein
MCASLGGANRLLFVAGSKLLLLLHPDGIARRAQKGDSKEHKYKQGWGK